MNTADNGDNFAAPPSLSVAPNYFISYSRSDTPLSVALVRILGRSNSHIWFDRDAIAIGDDWMAEIRAGISRCDEMILIATPNSLSSSNVELEAELALAASRMIRPLVQTGCEADLPVNIAQFHFETFASELDLEAAFRLIVGRNDNASDQALKVLLTNQIYPRFSIDTGQAALQNARPLANKIVDSFSEHSVLRLNLGLMKCRDGHWDDGLQLLTQYAHASESFVGWYFLALHLPRRRACTTLPPATCNSLVESTNAMRGFGDHGLSTLLEVIVRVGAQNLGMPTMRRLLDNWREVAQGVPEHPTEYQRFYWLLQPSMAALPGELRVGIKQYLMKLSGTA